MINSEERIEKAKSHFYEGLSAIAEEKWQKAEKELKKSLDYVPNRISTLTNLCAVLIKLKKFQEAKEFVTLAISADQNNAEAILNFGFLCSVEKKHEEALKNYQRAINLKPNLAEAWNNRGITLHELKRYAEALESYDQALAIKFDYAEALHNRGNSLHYLDQNEEALASYDQALALRPDYAEAWGNRGVALNNLARFEDALLSYDRAIALKPDYAEAWSNKGVALNELKRYEEALSNYDRAIALHANYAEAYGNRGLTQNRLKRHEEALRDHEKALALNPNLNFVLADMIYTKMKICDWKDFDSLLDLLKNKLTNNETGFDPFVILGIFDSPQLQKLAAEIYISKKRKPKIGPGKILRRPKRQKIRIGYFSMDFREHPVSYLVSELFDLHNRSLFELYGFSFGKNTGDQIRQRLELSFDKFLDVRNLTDLEIINLARQLEIDIAIDLGGHTQNSRPQIFLERVAPIQINYLGYPGTWGSDCMDYFIGDLLTINDKNIAYFSEKIIYLPNQFQVNPSFRPVSKKKISKASLGLPKDSFVFCCFNNTWKITPAVFRQWMRILQRTPKSILWLYANTPLSATNLQEEAERQGVHKDRIIFTARVDREEYMAHYQYADLFLDTRPYNAGTTASDALWAGVPVLTKEGASFASRMAASLLQNANLSELVAQTDDEYEALAIKFATRPEEINAAKRKLRLSRRTSPLFNTELFTKHIESAYRIAYEKYHSSIELDHIYVHDNSK